MKRFISIKRIKAIGILPLMLTLSGLSVAQPPCSTDTVWFNTGYNQAAGTTYPIGSADPYWTVTCDPVDSTFEPRSSFVISKNPAWSNPQPNTEWISSYPTQQNTRNGLYCFEFCFCVNPSGPLPDELNLWVRADDTAEVYLNGVSIGETDYRTWNALYDSTYISTTNYFQLGKNCLEVKLRNLYGVAMGLNIVGFVTGPDSCLLKQQCCDSTSQIQGRKWDDVNGDGIKQSGEPGLSGWTINLSNGMQTITDGWGYYYFNNLLPDTYTITETPQAGWTQTCPTTGSYTVTLSANQVETGLNFGNQSSGVPPIIPTLTEWGMIIFCVLLFGWMAWVIVRRRRRVTAGM